MGKGKGDRKREFCSLYGGHPECIVNKHEGDENFWVNLVKEEMKTQGAPDADIKRI